MAHKGTSVVLYANADIRRHQYTTITDWSGGLYISPGLPGSRNGALVAATWASLVRVLFVCLCVWWWQRGRGEREGERLEEGAAAVPARARVCVLCADKLC